MKKSILFLSTFLLCANVHAQRYHFSFAGPQDGATVVMPTDSFNTERGYGYDFINLPGKKGGDPFIFSVLVPDGNYKVTVTLGSKKKAASTTVRAESRRLFLNNIPTKKGELKTYSFIVNKRDTRIGDNDYVRIKPREKTKLNWDDKLSLEVTGDAPQIATIQIEQAGQDVTTLWLCGNSTVVDQDYEPWASWGQMITHWFDDKVAIANYAESGERASSFISEKRLAKIITLMKEGDYLFVEFGHNDQKEKGPGKGAYYNFATCLKTFIDEARAKGVTPIFVTPTQRRAFDPSNTKIVETHADYPEAMRWVAERERVQVIELHDMTRTFFEALGFEGSKNALVHYPANTYPGQPQALADNTHFNPYGAYEISKMIIEGIKALQLPIASHIKDIYTPFNPATPDDIKSFHWVDSKFFEVAKPDGN